MLVDRKNALGTVYIADYHLVAFRTFSVWIRDTLFLGGYTMSMSLIIIIDLNRLHLQITPTFEVLRTGAFNQYIQIDRLKGGGE